MKQNKTSKYLKYAIGEIILVVIGILIALQINNWNENRKSVTKSKSYLTEIIKDLESDIIQFNRGLEGLSENIKMEEWVLSQDDYKTSQLDSLWVSFGGWYFNYYINDRTFQKIQNAEESELTGFDSIYNKIIDYYTVLKQNADGHTDWDVKEVMERQTYMKDLEAKIEMSNSRLHDFGNGEVDKKFPMRQDSTKQAELVIAFANSTRGRNHYKNNYLRHIRLRNKFQHVVQEATKLSAEIELVLENVN